MVNETPAGLLTVRGLGQALDEAHLDQVVIVALAGQELSELEAAVSNGPEVVFAVKIELPIRAQFSNLQQRDLRLRKPDPLSGSTDVRLLRASARGYTL